jgi:ABC-type antimicrobial peptide transport system permease subunit
MTLTVIGAGMGMLGALALGRVLSGLLYGISWYDPITLGATALLVTVVAFVACAQPARRATRLDPIRVLRAE